MLAVAQASCSVGLMLRSVLRCSAHLLCRSAFCYMSGLLSCLKLLQVRATCSAHLLLEHSPMFDQNVVGKVTEMTGNLCAVGSRCISACILPSVGIKSDLALFFSACLKSSWAFVPKPRLTSHIRLSLQSVPPGCPSRLCQTLVGCAGTAQCMAAAPQSMASCPTSSSQQGQQALSPPCPMLWTRMGSPPSTPGTR